MAKEVVLSSDKIVGLLNNIRITKAYLFIERFEKQICITPMLDLWIAEQVVSELRLAPIWVSYASGNFKILNGIPTTKYIQWKMKVAVFPIKEIVGYVRYDKVTYHSTYGDYQYTHTKEQKEGKISPEMYEIFSKLDISYILSGIINYGNTEVKVQEIG